LRRSAFLIRPVAATIPLKHFQDNSLLVSDRAGFYLALQPRIILRGEIVQGVGHEAPILHHACRGGGAFFVAAFPAPRKKASKEDARKAGAAAGSAARKSGKAQKKPARRSATKRRSGPGVGGAAKEGAQEFKRAFKGEK